MKSLREYCEIAIMRNHKHITNFGSMPFYLLENVLRLFKPEQLTSVEDKSPLLILDDDHLWYNFLKTQYPTTVHDLYTSKREIVVNYYKNFIKSNISDYHNFGFISLDELIDLKIRHLIHKENGQCRYRIPYRKLFFKYRAEEIRKQEMSAEKLRSQMQQIKLEREKKQTVKVDSSFFERNYKRNTKGLGAVGSIYGSNHSKLFIQSIKAHDSRSKIFKGPRHDFTPIASRKKHSPTSPYLQNSSSDTATSASDSDIKISSGSPPKLMGFRSYNSTTLPPNKDTIIITDAIKPNTSSQNNKSANKLPSTLESKDAGKQPSKRIPIKRPNNDSPSIFLKKKKPDLLKRCRPTPPHNHSSLLSHTNKKIITQEKNSEPNIIDTNISSEPMFPNKTTKQSDVVQEIYGTQDPKKKRIDIMQYKKKNRIFYLLIRHQLLAAHH
ncbi:hypothetical protein TBLA_0B00200 [Henningerozyma blattae CBS 6284]|uniref:Elongin-A n=1 Tax=Henningerozyma blattae (strain ATCC 34711 / CBS 6284 / DSM 70876 / NBRC 10599 / NRRL Y-10934 / UCD 77-7) TaxID=1071380 RepID=I2GXL3_HENB6|nr:hypothetical protein TBLA_0B00200 [Tetrapisispora blattae CBS 6284]CCH58865.1 hypothetical protein TBLA_0B00200 [Tetrapisispora blattae CBS 6284]